MPLVAWKKLHIHAIILKQRMSWAYIPDKALWTPSSMPSSLATRSTTCYGIRSKHFT